MWTGAVTSSSVTVAVVVDSSADVRLAVDTDDSFGDPTYHGPRTPDSQGAVKLTATGLSADTVYHLAIEHDGVLDTSTTGRARTLPTPSEPASFTIVASGDAGLNPVTPGAGSVLASDRLSNHEVFGRIRERAVDENWLALIHLGDLHYYDLGSGNHGISGGASLASYRRSYEDVLTQPRQHELYRTVPTVYTWDDHDWGPNNSDGTHEGADAAQQAYRERVPHHTLPDPDGAIYHSFTVGRVLFLVADTRSYRSPNSAPDDASKTMLGERQKTWMRDTLEASDARALVWVMSSQWMGLSGDSWASFKVEQAEMIALFEDIGWLDRMLIISADVHVLAIDSGGESPGGIPVFQFSSFDSSSGTPAQQDYDLGPPRPGRGQYGTLTVTDDGGDVSILGTCWYGDDQIFRQHTVVIEADQAPEVPPAAPAPIATPRITRTVTWLSVNATDGRIIAELPDVSGKIGRLLSAHSSHRLSLPLPTAGPGHMPIELIERATRPVTTALVAVVNDVPVWMGWVLSRRGGTDGRLELATVTPEGYLRRRRVGDHRLVDVDRALVATVLAEDAGDVDGLGAGLGWTLDVELTGETISREYVGSDRETVYDAIRELAADGLEFTVDLDWADTDQTSVRKLLRIRPRIGVARDAPPVLESEAGAAPTYTLLEDSTSGRHANHLIVTAPGEGEDQPASSPAIDQAALDGGDPIVEEVVDVSSAAADKATLDELAPAELARRRAGARVWDLTARLDAYPRLGVDVMLGDAVAWQLRGHRHPDGVGGTGRMVGWSADLEAGTWTPQLLHPQEEVVS